MTGTARAAAVVLAAAAFLAASAPARATDPEQARELFKQGSVYFDLGQFDRAIELWQRAYEQKTDPAILYNIAQAYRLAGDARKAIFFYKSFLRNSPSTPERREVEQKIAALQKQLPEGERAGSGAASGPGSPGGSGSSAAAGGPGSPPVAGGATSPPPVGAEPDASAGAASLPVADGSQAGGPPAPTAPAPFEAPPVTATTPAPALAPPAVDRRFDLGAAVGSSFWLSGIQGSAKPAVSASVTAGYLLGSGARPVRFRLGGRAGLTFLTDVGSTLGFISLLADPSLQLRLVPQRLFLTVEAGAGLLILTGLEPSSALLERGAPLMVMGGSQQVLEIRPAITLEYLFAPRLSGFLASGLSYSPKQTYFYAPWLRLELHLGLALRL